MRPAIKTAMVLGGIAAISVTGALVDSGSLVSGSRVDINGRKQTVIGEQARQPPTRNGSTATPTNRNRPPAPDNSNGLSQGQGDKDPVDILLQVLSGGAAVFSAMATIVLAVLAWAQYKVYRRQLRIMHRQTLLMGGQHELMKATFDVTYRPKLIIRELRCLLPPGIVRWRMTNTGGSEAVIFKVEYAFSVRRGLSYHSHRSNEPTPIRLASGDNMDFSVDIDPEAVRLVTNEQEPATGKFEAYFAYRGGGRGSYQTKIARMVDPKTSRLLPTNDPDQEYND